jgi:hypothetical protein
MTTNLDLTTLAWCLPEIRSSLLKAEESLQAFFSQPEQKDIVPLQVAAKAVYQASGALRVIGLEGVEMLADEAKALITGIEKKEIAEGKLLKPTLTALSASFSAVIGYLEALPEALSESIRLSSFFLNNLQPLKSRVASLSL